MVTLPVTNVFYTTKLYGTSSRSARQPYRYEPGIHTITRWQVSFFTPFFTHRANTPYPHYLYKQELAH